MKNEQHEDIQLSKLGKVSVRLLKDKIKDPVDAIKKKSLKDLKPRKSRLDSPPTTLFVRQVHREEPEWIPFLNALAAEPIKTSNLVSLSALLFLKVDGRYFAFTFGPGSQSFLKPECIEYNFGFDVASKILSPDAINSVEACYLEPNAMRQLKQFPLSTDFSRFGMNHNRDHVLAIGGKTKDSKFGKRVTGAQALVATEQLSLHDIVLRCRRWLKVYSDKTLERVVENVVTEVRDETQLTKLNAALQEKIKTNDLDSVVIGIPEMVNIEEIDGYRFSNSLDKGFGFDLTIEGYLNNFRNARLCTIDNLISDSVVIRNSTDGSTQHKWSVYDCLQVEVVVNNQTYLLYSGVWYLIPKTEIESVNREVDKIQNSKVDLPPSWAKEVEGDYNVRASNGGLPLFDKKLIRGPGFETGIEACDLLSTKDNSFIHVKRGTDSASLSHLFRQGINSALMFNTNTDFRNEFESQLKKAASPASVQKFMTASTHTVIFGIITRKTGPWSKSLPYFSKLSLCSAVTELKSMRFNVELARIEQRDGAAVKTLLRRAASADFV